MSITVKAREVGNTTEKLRKGLRDLSTSKVSVGHYESQGMHSSGMSFVDLLNLWSQGVIFESEDRGGYVVRQDVRKQFIMDYVKTNKLSRDKKVDAAILKWGQTLDKQTATADLLDSIGEVLRSEYKDKFNNVASPFMDATSTPLFETGELASATAYKHTKNNTVKES